MIVEQVDFVDVEQPIVGCGENTGFKMAFPSLDGFFNIEGANNAVFGC